MATLNMEGPYTFNQMTINQKVTKKSAVIIKQKLIIVEGLHITVDFR